MNESDILFHLKETIRSEYGSQKKFAQKHKLSAAYLNDMLMGRKPLNTKVLDALGLERVVTYRFKVDLRKG